MLMYTEEFGDPQSRTLVLIHGAFFTNTFGRQYVLQDRYHLVVPHLFGFGQETACTFEVDAQIAALKELCQSYADSAQKPTLVGFSLGAQLAFRLVSEEPGLFSSAVIVSPWLTDKDSIPQQVMDQNLKIYHQLQNKLQCNLIALMNGMPKNQRREFVESMQHVSEQTVRNAVDTGICFDTVPSYTDLRIPILALAGSKETDAVKKSVRLMAEKNPCCKYEIWDGASHNIPPVFAKRFNQTLVDFIG
jgi:pimeloyl-ACP methyl ester carboxylesterase